MPSNYAFDTNTFQAMSHFYPERFPSFWVNFDGLVKEGRIYSTKENLREYTRKDFMKEWIKKNKIIFYAPSPEEASFVQ